MATEAELSATHRLGDWPAAAQRAIRFLLLDIDDTLTTDGRLTAAAYAALERLSQRGLRVIPVTGRPGREARSAPSRSRLTLCRHIAARWSTSAGDAVRADGSTDARSGHAHATRHVSER